MSLFNQFVLPVTKKEPTNEKNKSSMGKTTNISWTDVTWNIARGCSKVDADCKYCYMYRDANRYGYDAKAVTKTKTVFNLPLKIKEPSRIFTSSLTDVFHPDCDSFRNEMWDIIRKCPQHTFQILTKRPERIADHLPADWGDGWENVWLGTSVGSMQGIKRALDLINLRPIAKTLFLSLEPLHSEINFRWAYVAPIEKRRSVFFEGKKVSITSQHELLLNIDWVIVGGESGNESGKYRYRPCNPQWIEQIVADCKAANVPVFVKQLGTHLSKEMGLKDRHGGDINEWPEYLQIREFPKGKEAPNG